MTESTINFLLNSKINKISLKRTKGNIKKNYYWKIKGLNFIIIF